MSYVTILIIWLHLWTLHIQWHSFKKKSWMVIYNNKTWETGISRIHSQRQPVRICENILARKTEGQRGIGRRWISILVGVHSRQDHRYPKCWEIVPHCRKQRQICQTDTQCQCWGGGSDNAHTRRRYNNRYHAADHSLRNVLTRQVMRQYERGNQQHN